MTVKILGLFHEGNFMYNKSDTIKGVVLCMERTMRWLMDGDVSVQYLTQKLLQHRDEEELREVQSRIMTEGFATRYLACRNANGHWGIWYYQPKWTCTHYVLADLKSLGMPQSCAPCREMVIRAIDECMLPNGGINFAKTQIQSDVCIDGMFVDYAAYFCPDEPRLFRLADYILSVQKPDGGFGWDHASAAGDPHTTICVLEGFLSYKKAGFPHLIREIDEASQRAIEWLLRNDLFIHADKRYTKLSYPCRYRYDLLRALSFFAHASLKFDRRMLNALTWLKHKQKQNGAFVLDHVHKGNVHFDLELKGEESRYVTVTALHVLNCFGNAMEP